MRGLYRGALAAVVAAVAGQTASAGWLDAELKRWGAQLSEESKREQRDTSREVKQFGKDISREAKQLGDDLSHGWVVNRNTADRDLDINWRTLSRDLSVDWGESEPTDKKPKPDPNDWQDESAKAKDPEKERIKELEKQHSGEAGYYIRVEWRNGKASWWGPYRDRSEAENLRKVMWRDDVRGTTDPSYYPMHPDRYKK